MMFTRKGPYYAESACRHWRIVMLLSKGVPGYLVYKRLPNPEVRGRWKWILQDCGYFDTKEQAADWIGSI